VTDDLTPDQAARLLAAVANDQTATRAAALPPGWFFIAMPVVMGVAIAANAIPVDWISLVVLAVDLPAAIVSMVLMLRGRTVRMKSFAALRPFWPAGLPWLAIWAVILIVCLAMVIPWSNSFIAWWAWILIGAATGFGLHLVASRSWRRWATEAPHEP